MNMPRPHSAIVEVPDTNMNLLIGQDEFGCVSLTLGMKHQKMTQDVSLPNAELEPLRQEVLRKNCAFRADEFAHSETFESLSKLCLIQAVSLNGFENQKLFSLAGHAYVKWKKLVDPSCAIAA